MSGRNSSSAASTRQGSRTSPFSFLGSAKPPEYSETFELRVQPRVVFYLLLACVAFLTIANVLMHTAAHAIDRSYIQPGSKLVNFFDLNHEGNLPSWYQSVTLVLCGLLLILISLSYLRKTSWVFGGSWLVLGLAFCYLSLDELVSLHETVVVPMRRWLDIDSGIFYFIWVVPAALVLGTFLLCLLPFLRALPAPTRNRFIISGLVYVSGAMIVEMIGGAYLTSEGGGDNYTYKLIASFEEFLEMMGVALFMRAILLDLVAHPISVHFGSEAEETALADDAITPTPIAAARAS